MIIIFALQKIFPSLTDFFLLNSSFILSRPWTIVTSIFVHGGIVHLLYNIFSLSLFGLILEKRIGSKTFLLVFFIGGIFANLFCLPFYNSSLGASGAIFAVIGMLTVIRPKMVVWIAYIPMRMWFASICFVFVDFLMSLAPDATNVGSIAHLSGIAFGFIAGFIWKRKKHKKNKN